MFKKGCDESKCLECKYRESYCTKCIDETL